MKNYKIAKSFIRAFGLKRGYTVQDLKSILQRQGFSLYEYTAQSKKAKLLFDKLDCINIAKADNSFSVCSGDVKLCCIRKSVTDKEKTILLLHENLHIFVGDVKEDCTILPIQEKTVTDLHFIVDFVLNARRYIRLLLAILVTFIIFVTIHHFTYSNSTKAYFYVTPSGTHYHKEDCDEVISNPKSYKIPADDAFKSYLPCSKCKPDKKGSKK